MPAARNINLCTKDCLCLFVCPSGATDTETGQIDPDKCIDGCRLCIDSCPSHAIYMIPKVYPAPQKKTAEVRNALLDIAASKTEQELVASSIKKETTDPSNKRLAKAIEMSCRIMAEDCIREAGYMLPQSDEVKTLLQSILDSSTSEDFPKEIVERLIALL